MDSQVKPDYDGLVGISVKKIYPRYFALGYLSSIPVHAGPDARPRNVWNRDSKAVFCGREVTNPRNGYLRTQANACGRLFVMGSSWPYSCLKALLGHPHVSRWKMEILARVLVSVPHIQVRKVLTSVPAACLREMRYMPLDQEV